MSHIFISYSRKDIDFAQKIVDALAENDLDTWIDWKSIPKGEDWEQEIYRGIEEAEAFLFLVSPDSVTSKMCNKEVAQAVANGKRILPIVIRDADVETFLTDNARVEISKRNWIFCREGQDNFDRAIKDTHETIHTDYEWLRYHTNLLIKALEWERSKYKRGFLLHGEGLEEHEKIYFSRVDVEPHLTELQKQYVATSRIEQDKRNSRLRIIRYIIGGIAIVAAIAIVLAVLFRRRVDLAQLREQQAISTATVALGREEVQIATAQAEATRAEEEANTRATAQAVADEQSNISRVREIAALAESYREKDFQLSLLLGIEGFRTRDIFQTYSVLLENVVDINPRIRQYLSKHTNIVNSVAFSPDGNVLVSGSEDFSTILWDVESGHPIIQPLVGHTDGVKSVAFNPDGKIIASASKFDGKIILWNAESGQPIREPLTRFLIVDGKPLLEQSNIGVDSIVFSPDGKLLASDSDIDGVLMWDMESGQYIDRPMKIPRDSVNIVAFSPDGKILASDSIIYQGIVLWDLRSGQLIGDPLITGNIGSIHSLVFNPDGKLLASGESDNNIILWDMGSRKPIGQPLKGHTEWVNSMAFSPDGKLLASGSDDSSIILWDVENRAPIDQPLTGHIGAVNSVAFSPDGKMLASGSDDNDIILWDVENIRWEWGSTESIGELLTEDYQLVITGSIALSPDGKILATGSTSNSIILWDVRSKKPIGKSLTGHTDLVNSLSFSPDGKTLASGGRDKKIILWDVEKREPIGKPLAGNAGWVNNLVFSPDGKTLAAGIADSGIILWDVESGQTISNPLIDYTNWVDVVAFSPDGKTFASATRNGYDIILWGMEGGRPISNPLTGHTSWVKSLAFSPDGQMLASGSADSSIILWDVESGEFIGSPLTGHNGWVTSLAFSPDGKILASGETANSSVNNIILWDVESKEPISEPLIGHINDVKNLTFGPDGKMLISGGSSQVILWDLNPQSWIKFTCQRVGRNFTQAEWQQYFPGDVYRITCPQWPAGE